MVGSRRSARQLDLGKIQGVHRVPHGCVIWHAMTVHLIKKERIGLNHHTVNKSEAAKADQSSVKESVIAYPLSSQRIGKILRHYRVTSRFQPDVPLRAHNNVQTYNIVGNRSGVDRCPVSPCGERSCYRLPVAGAAASQAAALCPELPMEFKNGVTALNKTQSFLPVRIRIGGIDQLRTQRENWNIQQFGVYQDSIGGRGLG